MKRILLSLMFTLLIIPAFAAHAQEMGEKTIGVGLMVGEPTGFSGKVWWDDIVAFDGGLAWSFADDTDISIHGDVLWHNWDVLTEAFEIERDAELPLYYGVGVRLSAGDDSRLGIRFVAGASLVFDEAPLDVFFEIAPIMDVAPETTLRAHTVIGVRVWF